MNAKLITLTTDFGLRDAYVAAMKGAILSRAPEVRIIDVTHEIPPGEIASAAFVLRQAAAFFPTGTVHLVVVDPGVGSERRAIACECGPHLYVAPDNGVLQAAGGSTTSARRSIPIRYRDFHGPSHAWKGTSGRAP
jgi:S-adenosylmethionine hydrolase